MNDFHFTGFTAWAADNLDMVTGQKDDITIARKTPEGQLKLNGVGMLCEYYRQKTKDGEWIDVHRGLFAFNRGKKRGCSGWLPPDIMEWYGFANSMPKVSVGEDRLSIDKFVCSRANINMFDGVTAEQIS